MNTYVIGDIHGCFNQFIHLLKKIDYKKMKEIAKTNHSMAHSHSNSVLLEPNKSGEIIWKFNTEIDLEAACNVPGHYESGMISNINIIYN